MKKKWAAIHTFDKHVRILTDVFEKSKIRMFGVDNTIRNRINNKSNYCNVIILVYVN